MEPVSYDAERYVLRRAVFDAVRSAVTRAAPIAGRNQHQLRQQQRETQPTNEVLRHVPSCPRVLLG